MFVETVSYFAALAAGLMSFFSPCVLPLIPAYFTFITGLSLDELTENDSVAVRKQVVLSTIAYVMGFSFVFILMGAAVSTLGELASRYSDYIRIAGGIIIIILGIHLLGIFKISKLEFDKRIHFKKKPLHIFGTFLVGMAFAAGWSPCIGPMLGAILAIAAQEGSLSHGIVLLSIYSAGMALPFIIMSVFINYMLAIIGKATKVLRYVNVGSGLFLIVIGILLLINKMNILYFN